MKRENRFLTALLALCLLLGLAAFPTSAAESVESATAVTMQLAKTEGGVGVANSSGRGLSVRDNMRLYNGYRVESEAKSYAWINLDSEKLAKLDESSQAELRKFGKTLELLLNEGNLYFNVTKLLESGETLNIRTSTMAVGIRGTSGWIKAIDERTSEIYVLDGTVQCSVTDPVTGQLKTETVREGEKAIAVAYSLDRDGDRCDFLKGRFGEDEIDAFVRVELVRVPDSVSEDADGNTDSLTPSSEAPPSSDSGTNDVPEQDLEDEVRNPANGNPDPSSGDGAGDSSNDSPGGDRFGNDVGTGSTPGTGTTPDTSSDP